MFEKIPAELRKETAWVNVWNGSKCPMKSTVCAAASSSAPETWSTFDDAVQAVEQERYDGIGYVFHDTGLVGIDIDVGYDGCIFSQLAIDIVGKCKSYTEKSRSGRGVHILLRGNLPFKGKNNQQGVEIYTSARYFIMTGKVLVFDEIVENQAAIDYVLEKYFPETEREKTGTRTGQRIYSPVWKKPENGKITLRPDYPTIISGGRNISLASVAGQMHTTGYDRSAIYRELLYINETACEPPLPRSELEQIVKSITRYRR